MFRMQTPVSTPQKLKQKLDLLLTPGSEKKSLELPSDVDEEFTLLPVPSTAVNPATLDAGSDIVLVHVPNEIDVEKLEGTEILLPCAHQEVGRVGDTYEVSTVQNEDDAGVYVLGIEDNQPSVVKVAALYSLQLALVEPEAEEEGIDQEALEALRAAQTGGTDLASRTAMMGYCGSMHSRETIFRSSLFNYYTQVYFVPEIVIQAIQSSCASDCVPLTGCLFNHSKVHPITAALIAMSRNRAGPSR